MLFHSGLGAAFSDGDFSANRPRWPVPIVEDRGQRFPEVARADETSLEGPKLRGDFAARIQTAVPCDNRQMGHAVGITLDRTYVLYEQLGEGG
ncbi:MAG TPA: hypothetical protein PLW65_24820, partial [Pseudomonadota bacterium]|nr:hypothetical protein [Pseudomonadota bacterium]